MFPDLAVILHDTDESLLTDRELLVILEDTQTDIQS